MNKLKNDLAKNSLIVFVLTTTGSAINYLCQILMGRFFTVENYGIINTIFSLTLIVSVIGNTASMILSKVISENKKNTSGICNRVIEVVNVSCLALIIIGLCFTPFLLKVLGNNYLTAILTMISIVTSIYPILYQGIFGGLHKFVNLGAYTLIIPIIKIAGLLVIVVLGLTGNLEVYMTILSIIIGNLISIVIGNMVVKKNLSEVRSNSKTNIKKIWKNYSDVFWSNILIMFLMNIDILYLSYFYDSKTIGLYSSVLVFGKMIYYFVTALVTVMLPLVSKHQKDDRYIHKMLNQTLLYTFILTAFLLIPTNIFAETILNMIFGNKYITAIPYMKYASFISLSYSLNLVLLNYLVGINKIKYIKKSLMVGSICITIILLIFNQQQYFSLLMIGSINIIVFVINLLKIQGSRLVGGKANEER